jgi:hypothetical protein
MTKATVDTSIGRIRRIYFDLNQFFDRASVSANETRCIPKDIDFGPRRIGYIAAAVASLDVLENATIDEASVRNVVDGLRAVSVLARELGNSAAAGRIEATLDRWANQRDETIGAAASQALSTLRHRDPLFCK